MNELKKEERIKQTITSEKTIYWGETADKEMNWEDSKDWCEEKGGRLPTLKELKKAYKDGVKGFNPTGDYWSSTPYTYGDAYYVRFSDCASYLLNTPSTYSVRCVYDK